MKKLIVLLIIPFFFNSCNTGKYVSSYKQIKKTIDTLVILTPMVVIDASEYNGKQIIDEELENKVKKILTEKAENLLNSKYILEKDFTVKNYNKLEISEFMGLLNCIKDVKNHIENHFFPKSVKEDYIKSKYYLFIYLKGHYTIGVSPYETLGTNNTINITPFRTANEEVGVLLIYDKKVLYFNSVFSINDPRLQELVERDFLKVIKSIYYK